MHAMKMSVVDPSDVKQHVPISLSRRDSSLTYAKPYDPWSFHEVHTADHCSLPISRWAWQTKLYHYFAYHVKTSIPQCNEDAIQMGESQMTQPPCSSVNLTESVKSSRLKQAVYLLWKQDLLSLHEQKDMFAKKCCIDFHVDGLANCHVVGILTH